MHGSRLKYAPFGFLIIAVLRAAIVKRGGGSGNSLIWPHYILHVKNMPFDMWSVTLYALDEYKKKYIARTRDLQRARAYFISGSHMVHDEPLPHYVYMLCAQEMCSFCYELLCV